MNARPFGLTDRQVQILALLADGLGNAEIGQKLYLSEQTVKSHLSRAARQMGCRSRAGMVALAYRHRVLALPDLPVLPPDMTAEMVALARMVMSDRPLGSVRASAKRVTDWAAAQGRAA